MVTVAIKCPDTWPERESGDAETTINERWWRGEETKEEKKKKEREKGAQ